jgi:hypothetical protein
MFCNPEVSSVTRQAGRVAAGLALALCLPLAAFAQTKADVTCGPEVKEEIAQMMAKVENADDAQKESVASYLYGKYQYCIQDAAGDANAVQDLAVAARQCGAGLSQVGSTFYEEMSCCGYDPQRRQFACPVKIKQRFGFGGAPLPGSREHVLHCVANAAGVLVPVGHDSVHLANEIFGQQPT